ncbi:MAG TPA: TPM domain-containing protein, partial [Longimicrobiales bacterium]|nr:TPM domain-containing protein [Longimicrobiales bacterium]
MTRHFTAVALGLALLIAAGLAGAPTVVARQLSIPAPVGYVNDFADVLSPADEAAIDAIIQEVRQKSGGEIVVVTLRSLEGRPASEVALQIGREWRIGQAGEPGDPARNTGLVFLVVPRETSPDGRGYLRIETGIGTNTFITAAEAGSIADRYVIPAFQAGDYATGIRAGVIALAAEYAERFGFQLSGDAAGTPKPTERPVRIPITTIIFIAIVVLIVLRLLLGRGGRGGGGR